MSEVTAEDTEPSPLTERRRPGRIDAVNPGLIPLLRGQVSIEDPINPEIQRRTDRKLVSAQRAISIVLLLTAVLWVSVLLGGWSWLIEAPPEPPRASPVIYGTGAANPAKLFTAAPY